MNIQSNKPYSTSLSTRRQSLRIQETASQHTILRVRAE